MAKTLTKEIIKSSLFERLRKAVNNAAFIVTAARGGGGGGHPPPHSADESDGNGRRLA